VDDPIDTPKPAPAPRFEWDRITAIMAVLIGACALAVSVYTARLQNAQVAAQTWPFLQLWYSNVDGSFSLSNRGVGPARIADVKLRVDGTEVANFEAMSEALFPGKPAPASTQSFFARRVLAANEDVTMIQFASLDDFNSMIAERDRIRFEICYCSVLDDCYRLDEDAPTENDFITPVDACPVGAPGLFR
jgi:hypothetical protein